MGFPLSSSTKCSSAHAAKHRCSTTQHLAVQGRLVEGAEPVLLAALKPIASSMRSCGFSAEADIATGAQDAGAAQLQQAGTVRISYYLAHPCRLWMCCCADCMPKAVHGCRLDNADDQRVGLTEHCACNEQS